MDLETVDHLLTTTRSVRRRLNLVRPVEPEIIERCLEIACQAPTGSNAQTWFFVVVTDAEKRAALANLYRRAAIPYLGRAVSQAAAAPGRQASQTQRVIDSAHYLAQHLQDVPVLIIPCLKGRVEHESVSSQASFYGSILPATWSLMLALRARGLGSAWTTFHLWYEQEAAALLGIPAKVTQAALLPVAYFLGEDFQPAARLPVRERSYWNQWGQKRGEA